MSVGSAAATPTASRWPFRQTRIDGAALSAWLLAGATVLYLALDGGGYDILVRSQVGILVWWIVLVGAAWGLLPATRLTRVGWFASGLFGCFVTWTALATTWSISSERSLETLSLVTFYFGVLVLALAIHREREQAVRHTVNAVAAAVVVVACLALVSRLRPDLFPAAQQTSSFLTKDQGRLNWPLDYWNALAAMMALSVPLLLSIASSARRLTIQAAAAGAIPIVALCGYLTFSRGGLIECAAGLVVFLALSEERVPKVATALVAATGGAALIAGAVHRRAIEQGLSDQTARHQGSTLLISIVLVSVGVGVVQIGIGMAHRHGTPPRWLLIPRARARRLLIGCVLVAVAAALVAGAPSRLSHAWNDFKQPKAAALRQDSIVRYGSLSGNGRYEVWKAAVDATSGHVLGGSGPGTFQLLWLPRAPYYSYVENAHSLYFETLSELGVVGLVLLVGFLAVALGAAVRHAVRARYEARTQAAGLAGAMVVFTVGAAFDWLWQMPVLPVAFLALAAAALTRSKPGASAGPLGKRAFRIGAVVIALAGAMAIAVPLATASAVRKSQAAASAGATAQAIADARSAARIEPGAASPQIQLALLFELQGDYRDGLVAARRATADEPENWTAWLIASRLEAEDGRAKAAVAAFRRARSLNPQSPLFK